MIPDTETITIRTFERCWGDKRGVKWDSLKEYCKELWRHQTRITIEEYQRHLALIEAEKLKEEKRKQKRRKVGGTRT